MMEEINATILEYQPLQVLWCSFVQPCPMNHPSPPDSLVTQDDVESATRSSSKSVQPVFCYCLKVLLSQIFYVAVAFFIFIAHFTRTSMNPGISPFKFHFMYYTWLSNNYPTYSFNQTCIGFSPVYFAQVN